MPLPPAMRQLSAKILFRMEASRWIWHTTSARNEWNQWVAFRKEFDLSTIPDRATLQATADAQYAAYINGVWVGQGPARAFPDDWRYDTFEVAHLLRPGRNCLSLLGHSIGVSTFRYILSNSGVRALLTTGGEQALITDSTWKCLPDCFGPLKEFRMACQLGWLEPPVKRRPDWQLPGFDDSNWPSAVEVVDARALSPAEVQVVPTGEVFPGRIVGESLVSPPATIWAIALRSLLLPGYTGAAPRQISGVVAAMFHVEHAHELVFEFQKSWFWAQAAGTLNGVPLQRVPSRRNPFESGFALAGQAAQGKNCLILEVTAESHDWTMTVAVDDVALLPEGGFIVVGPLEPGESSALLHADAEALAQHPRASVLDPRSDARCALSHPFARTAHARHISDSPSQQRPGEVFLCGRNNLEGQAILDLGRMTVGYWSFEVEPTGPTPALTLNGFESIQSGTPDFCWEMSNTMEVGALDATEAIRSLQRRGSRYVLLQGKDVCVRNFKVVEATAPLGEGARFQSSDPLLDHIFEMCKLTARLCSEDTFVDCPTYEQTFWVGDARNEALVHQAVFGDPTLPARCWRLAAKSLDQGPLVNSHVPSGWETTIPAWSFLWSVGCWEHFLYTADKDFLVNVYPAMLRQAKNAAAYLNAGGLFEMEAWNLTDWAPMDQPRNAVSAPNQGWFILAADATRKAARAVGDWGSAEQLGALVEKVRAATNRVLWNNRRKAYTDCLSGGDGSQSQTFSIQTQCVLALAGIPTGERSLITKEILLRRSEGFVQPGTPFFLFFLLQYMERESAHLEMAALIKHWWGAMVQKGATTCWELLPGYMPGGRWTRSHCHAWGAGPAYFLLRNQLGCVPVGTQYRDGTTLPSWRKLLFAPKPAGLEWCRGEVPTPGGLVRAEWRRDVNGLIEYEIEAPEIIEVVVGRGLEGSGEIRRV